MLIEQIRYFFNDEARDEILDVRRQESRIREDMGLPRGVILLPDTAPDDEPMLAWQCGYEDESEMGAVEQALLGSDEYRAVRNRLGDLVTRVEMELYVTDEE
jgi:hypothetical protein